jgi:hypothetical protein
MVGVASTQSKCTASFRAIATLAIFRTVVPLRRKLNHSSFDP